MSNDDGPADPIGSLTEAAASMAELFESYVAAGIPVYYAAVLLGQWLGAVASPPPPPPGGTPVRVRYETRCGGRLLKVTEQIDVTAGPCREADGTQFVDGSHWWMIDEQRVADDIAQAMLRAAGDCPADDAACEDTVYRERHHGEPTEGWETPA